MKTLVALLLVCTACSRGGGTPSDFAAAWQKVDAIEDPQKRGDAMQAFAKDWRDKWYDWEGLALASLCVNADKSCAMNFWAAVPPESRRTLGGLYPRVRFTEDGWKALHEQCKGRTSCVMTVHGSIGTVAVDPDMPLRVEIMSADVKSTRQPQSGDAWFAASTTPVVERGEVGIKPDDAVVSNITTKTPVF